MATRLTGFIVVTIVVVTLVAGLIVGAQRDDNGPVDLIVYNGKVFRGADGLAEAVAVRGNQILRVGSNREIRRLRRIQTTMVDARGGTVLAGFNDAHTHFAAGALELDHVDLGSATTPTEALELIRRHAAAHPDRMWIEGRGWHFPALPPGQPTKEDLDAAVPDRPARMLSADGAVTWVNTKALELAGIGRRTRALRGGSIPRDPRTGEPVGLLRGRAAELLAPVLPVVSRADRVQAIRNAIEHAHRLGITSVQDAGVDEETLEAYDEIRRAGDLKLRVYAILGADARMSDEDARHLDALRARFPDDPLLKIGAVEFVVGAPEEQALSDQAGSVPGAGEREVTGRLERAATMMDRRGWQLVLHAGDASTRPALDLLARLASTSPPRESERRHRLEHGRLAEADATKLADLGIIASVRPAAHDDGSGAALADPVWRSAQKAGARIVFGSDWPAGPLAPTAVLAAALPLAADPLPDSDAPTREPDDTLTDVVAAYTSDAAFASFDEQRKGAIAPGMLADLVILERDLFGGSTPALAAADVLATIFDGKLVYSRVETSTDP